MWWTGTSKPYWKVLSPSFQNLPMTGQKQRGICIPGRCSIIRLWATRGLQLIKKTFGVFLVCCLLKLFGFHFPPAIFHVGKLSLHTSPGRWISHPFDKFLLFTHNVWRAGMDVRNCFLSSTQFWCFLFTKPRTSLDALNTISLKDDPAESMFIVSDWESTLRTSSRFFNKPCTHEPKCQCVQAELSNWRLRTSALLTGSSVPFYMSQVDDQTARMLPAL